LAGSMAGVEWWEARAFVEVTEHVGIRCRPDDVVLILMGGDEVPRRVQVQRFSGIQDTPGKEAIHDLPRCHKLIFRLDGSQRKGEDYLELGIAGSALQRITRFRCHRTTSSSLRPRIRRTRCTPRRRSKAPTFVLPFVLIVLLVSHDLEDEHLLTRIEDASDKTELVAADVENHAVTDETGVTKEGPNFRPGLPRNGPVADVHLPSSKRPLGVLTAW
jgi:hypothetical protein